MRWPWRSAGWRWCWRWSSCRSWGRRGIRRGRRHAGSSGRGRGHDLSNMQLCNISREKKKGFVHNTCLRQRRPGPSQAVELSETTFHFIFAWVFLFRLASRGEGGHDDLQGDHGGGDGKPGLWRKLGGEDVAVVVGRLTECHEKRPVGGRHDALALPFKFPRVSLPKFRKYCNSYTRESKANQFPSSSFAAFNC